MLFKRCLILISTLFSLFIFNLNNAFNGKIIENKDNNNSEIAKNECLNLKNCKQCYCSAKCNFRDKTLDDRPIFEAKDPNGKYCYCKQWDKDSFDANNCKVED